MILHHDPMGSIPGKQGWFNIQILINVMHHINRTKKGKSHNYVAEKAFEKVQYTLMIKILDKLEEERHILRPAEDNANIHSYSYHCACRWQQTNWMLSPLRSKRSKRGCSYHFYSQILTRAIRQSQSSKASGFKMKTWNYLCSQMTWSFT